MVDSKVGILDYTILVLTILISVLIGVFQGYKTRFVKFISKTFNNKIKDAKNIELIGRGNFEKGASELEVIQDHTQTSDYLTGNASVGTLPIAFSLLATFISTNAVLGYPAEVYQYGIQIWIFTLGIATSPIFAAFVIQPYFANLKISSIFEYIEMRYEVKSMRLMMMSCYVLRNFISSAMYVLGPSTALSLILNLDQNISIGLICVIGTFYTCIGGIKAVILSDLFQALIMIFCLGVVIIKGIIGEGGLVNILNINEIGGRLELFDFNPDLFTRQSFWSLYFGGMFLSALTYCFDQIALQRFQAAKSEKQAKLAILYNTPGLLLITGMCCFSGLIIYAKYHNCDPLYTKDITTPNQYLSYYVLENFSMIPGMIGVYLGGIFCSSLSSLSSYLNSQASIFFQDFLLLFEYFRRLNDKDCVKVNKLIVIISGFLIAALTYAISSSGNNLIQLSSSLNGTFNGPIVGLFLLSMFFSIANKYGAWGGFFIGLGINLWANIGALVVEPIYPPLDVSVYACFDNRTMSFNSTTISFAHLAFEPTGFNKFYALASNFYTTFGAITTVLTGILISICTGGLENKVDKSLFIYDLSKFLKKKKFI